MHTLAAAYTALEEPVSPRRRQTMLGHLQTTIEHYDEIASSVGDIPLTREARRELISCLELVEKKPDLLLKDLLAVAYVVNRGVVLRKVDPQSLERSSGGGADEDAAAPGLDLENSIEPGLPRAADALPCTGKVRNSVMDALTHSVPRIAEASDVVEGVSPAQGNSGSEEDMDQMLKELEANVAEMGILPVAPDSESNAGNGTGVGTDRSTAQPNTSLSELF